VFDSLYNHHARRYIGFSPQHLIDNGGSATSLGIISKADVRLLSFGCGTNNSLPFFPSAEEGPNSTHPARALCFVLALVTHFVRFC
jgi:hypothetical protein